MALPTMEAAPGLPVYPTFQVAVFPIAMSPGAAKFLRLKCKSWWLIFSNTLNSSSFKYFWVSEVVSLN